MIAIEIEIEKLDELAGRAVQPQRPTAVARNHLHAREHIDYRQLRSHQP